MNKRYSCVSLIEPHERNYNPELINFIMLENRCSYCRAIIIFQEAREIRKKRRKEKTYVCK